MSITSGDALSARVAIALAAFSGGGPGSQLLPEFAASPPPPRPLASPARLGCDGGAHGVGEGIFGLLSTREARPLRLVSRVLCADVRNARWYDRDTVITGDLRK